MNIKNLPNLLKIFKPSYLKTKPFHIIGIAAVVMLALVLVGYFAIYKVYRDDSIVTNAGSQYWDEVGSIQGTVHNINFAACLDQITRSAWEVDSFAGISPALPASEADPVRGFKGPTFTWQVSLLSSYQSQPSITKHTDSWIPGATADLSEIKIPIDINKTNILHFVSPGIVNTIEIDASELHDCTGSAPTSLYPTYNDRRSLSPAFLGFNAQPAVPVSNWTTVTSNSKSHTTTTSLNPKLEQAASELEPENYRVFGGTTANYWDWQQGGYTADALATSTNETVFGAKKLDGQIPLSDYTTLTKATSSYPIFDINIMTPPAACEQYAKPKLNGVYPLPAALNNCELADQVGLLRTAQSQDGQKIKYVELGNEFYNGLYDYPSYFPNAEVYAAKANYWIEVIKKDFPGVEVAVPGAWVNGSSQFSNWNSQLAHYITGESAITIHIYFNTGINAYNDVSCKQAYCLNQVHEMLANSANSGLSMTNSAISQIAADFAAYHKSMPSVWETEWNINDSSTDFQDSWVQGLIEAQYAIGLARNNSIELSVNHALINSPEYGALLEGSEFKLGNGNESTTLGVSSSGITLGTLLKSLKGATATAALTFPTSPSITGSSQPGVIGQLFTVNGKYNIFLMNLTDNSARVDIPTSLGTNFTQSEYYALSHSFVSTSLSTTSSKSHAIAKGSALPPPPNLISGSVAGSVVLQPYSVTSLVSE